MFIDEEELITQEKYGTIPEERFMTLRRVEVEVRKVASEYGFYGDPLAFEVPSLGSQKQEEYVWGLFLELPADVRLAASTMAKQMLRAMVLTHIEPPEESLERPTSGQKDESTCKKGKARKSKLSLSMRSR